MSVVYWPEHQTLHVSGNPNALKARFRQVAAELSGTDVIWLHDAADAVGGNDFSGDGFQMVRSEKKIPAIVAIRAMTLIGAGIPYVRRDDYDNPLEWDDVDVAFAVPEAPPPVESLLTGPEDIGDGPIDSSDDDSDNDVPPPPPPPPGA